MPLLERYLLSKPKDDDTVILHINHTMDNSFYFSTQLKRVYHDVIFVAVPYSNKQIPENFDCISYHAEIAEDEGYRLCRSGKKLMDFKCDFIHTTQALIGLALENELLAYAEQGKHIIIVEDGGYHYDIIRDCLCRHPCLKKAILGTVEQTTSGTRKSFSGSSELYPVLSVSRSRYKVRFEAYFVANRVIDGLVRLLHEIDEFVDFKSIVLLGYGIIGRSVAIGLSSRNVDIRVSDIDDNISKTAQRDGFAIWNGEFKENMLVIGNSGKNSFTSEMLEAFLQSKAKKLILASASSKQTEFNAVFPYLVSCSKQYTAHSTIFQTACGKTIVLLADGYPLNFVDESCDSLTYDMIDPVFTEIYLLVEYLRQNSKTLAKRTYLLGNDAKLDAAIDETMLIRTWSELNGLHIRTPDFNVHPNEKELINLEERI